MGPTDWRAVCGKTARTVLREGSPAQPDFPTPIREVQRISRWWAEADWVARANVSAA
jgi:hypothetical protein